MANQMKIKIVATEVGTAKTKTNKEYKFVEVTYKNISFDNKVESKKIMPFGSKEVFATLENSQPGDVYTILREKDEAGYWQWVGISEGDAPIETTQPATQGAPATKPVATPKSTFETPEERAKKQIYIIRQSSVANAVAMFQNSKTVPSVKDVLNIASTFENYVLGQLNHNEMVQPQELPELDDDIPL